MSEKINVQFEVANKELFIKLLQQWTGGAKLFVRYEIGTDSYKQLVGPEDGGQEIFLSDPNVLGYRADDYVSKRAALVSFVDAMEVKLRQNEHKTTWREKPIAALISLMLLEIEEFKVALEHFSVAEARAETPDAANFLMMIYDRMSVLNQDLNIKHPDQIK